MIQDYERSHPKLMMQSQGIYSSSKYLTCLYASQVKFCQVFFAYSISLSKQSMQAEVLK